MLLAGAIGAVILAGYALALWWLLRGERPATYTALVALCGLSLALRLVWTHDYPAGLNEDEPKNLRCSIEALQRGVFFGDSCNGPPYLLSAVFAAPLVPWVGENRWAMRSYSMATSVLATPAAFAVARAMGLRTAAALLAGGLLAVLPWALFYGRISLGGELIFHQLLLLAALARLVWPAAARGPAGEGRAPAEPGWREAGLGAFGLSLLLWDYYAGRSMMGMPVLAALLATGRRRWWCLAIPPLALFGWLPHLLGRSPSARVGFSLTGLHPDMQADPLRTLMQRGYLALQGFIWDTGQDGIFAVRAGAMHPVFVLGLAATGALAGVRRGAFLVGGFVGGLLPGVVSTMHGISGHRIMMAYAFVALAAACAVDLLPWRRARGALAAATLAAAAWWSTALYFSPVFWTAEARWGFDAERTALAEDLAAAPPPRLLAMKQFGYWAPAPAPGADVETLSFETWLPPRDQAVTYAFTWEAAPLRAQYERLFPGRVRSSASAAYRVDLEAGDWSWMRRHGWWLEGRCSGRSRGTPVPFLYTVVMPMRDFHCIAPANFVWRAHWTGPATPMVFEYTGAMTLVAADLSLNESGFERSVAFTMPADADVTITLEVRGIIPWPRAALYEVTPGGRRVPDWERFDPLPPSAG